VPATPPLRAVLFPVLSLVAATAWAAPPDRDSGTAAALLEITSLQEHQVFQRRSKTQGVVVVVPVSTPLSPSIGQPIERSTATAALRR